eukprot:353025-Chlamydomonas_euryale.AAC.3
MAAALRSARHVAIDLENHSFRSFQGFTCLMQVRPAACVGVCRDKGLACLAASLGFRWSRVRNGFGYGMGIPHAGVGDCVTLDVKG